MKRGQTLSVVVVFIIAVVIGLLIVIFGGRSIMNVLDLGEDTAMVQFEQTLYNQVSDHSPGSRRIFNERLPSGKFTLLCLANVDYLSPAKESELKTNPLYRIVWNSLEDNIASRGGANAFLLPDGSDALEVPPMEVDGGFICIPATGGRIRFGMEGRGNRTLIVDLEGI